MLRYAVILCASHFLYIFLIERNNITVQMFLIKKKKEYTKIKHVIFIVHRAVCLTGHLCVYISLYVIIIYIYIKNIVSIVTELKTMCLADDISILII